ncbi:uncharacterized protein LOC108154301 [Drosophila miranda]|uniref:uncharacterized protein LOC108154301 n=1 Tax=Drosophila miranda TaxID=7229 RepID=UPI0007E76DE1|nr:uncharacterized protein LOC108154301 [Drosophila miranda]
MKASRVLQYLLVCIAVALGLVLQANADCPLSRPMIEGTNRIFTNRDLSGNYAPKLIQSVQAGEVLHMICQPDDIVQTTCEPDTNFNPPLPMSCIYPMPATATIVTDASCPATMYSIGYTINNQQLELYRACYDRTNVRALFTTHTVYGKTFFPARPPVYFSLDNVLSPADASTFMPSSIYGAFRRIFGENQTYIPFSRDVVINRGHLTPSADFLYEDQMSATFKYVNVVPQFKTINDRNWEAIERWVRSLIHGGGSLRIKTGAVGTLKLPTDSEPPVLRPIILGDDTKNPVPEWMYKVVRTSTNQPVAIFLTYNNIYAPERPNALKFCETVPCPIFLPNTAVDGFTYCCNDTNNFELDITMYALLA